MDFRDRLLRNDAVRRVRERVGVPRKLAYDMAKQSFLAHQRVQNNTMLPYARTAVLYESVAHCERVGVNGSFVECGVWKGGAVGVMAQANLAYGSTPRELHLFDSFTDICEPDPQFDASDIVDETTKLTGERTFSGELVPLTGIYDGLGGHGSIEVCRALLVDELRYPETNIHFHPGWFQDTVPAAVSDGDPGEIAILRLDGDYYASTRVCLDGLYDKVASGGFVFIDDYGAYEGCRKAVHDFFESRGISPFLHYADDICRYWIKS